MIRRFHLAGRHLRLAAALASGVVVAALVVGRADATEPAPAARAAADSTPVDSTPLASSADELDAALATLDPDSLFGRSGKLFFRYVRPSRAFAFPFLSRLFGDSAASVPGIYRVADAPAGKPFSFITLVPFERKRGNMLNGYRIGFWPGERRSAVSDAYRNPEGFITVTPENQNTRVSEHFRLRDFLTKDQRNVWPKYLVLREELIDKLELVIAELERSGVDVKHMSVMSGFRTPQYNANGGSTSGRSSVSRHMYGDAADVFVDNDRDGNMDDLNRDGRVDTRDADIIIRAVERVEARHPELVGGVGRYRANRAHGPFAHIDVRGRRARWGGA